MTDEITMRHIRVLAGKRGYRVHMDKTHIHIIKKSDERITRSFDLNDPFGLDPPYARQFLFTRIYFWICGYDITAQEYANVHIACANHHLGWKGTQPREADIAYHSIFLLLCDIALWVHYHETHHFSPTLSSAL